MFKAFIKFVSLVFLFALVSVGGMQAQTVPEGLVLWNGLGGDDEVLNSFVGPDFEFYDDPPIVHRNNVAGEVAYEPGVVGYCVTPAGTGYYPAALIYNLELGNLQNVLNTERGTIEFWYYQTGEIPTVVYYYPVFRLFDGAFGLYPGVSLYLYTWDPAQPLRMVLRLYFMGSSCEINTEASFIPNHTWVHIAGCWDRNGIDGTADTMRLYANNQLVGSATANNWGTTLGQRADVCGGNGQYLPGKYKIDELKIWNYAKTNFTDPAEEFSVIAYNSVKIKTGCTIESGDVVVLDQTPGPHLSSLGQLAVGQYVHGHDNVAFKADTVDLQYGSTVYDVHHNGLTNGGTIRNAQVTPLTLPVQAYLPVVPAPTPGSQDVSIPDFHQMVLQPGSYGIVTVYNGANLIFEGGTYHLKKLIIQGAYCAVYFRGPTELNIKKRFLAGDGMTLGPESAGLDIKDIRINVNYASPTPTTSAAVRIAPYSMLRAVVHAPNGTIKIKNGCTVEGTLIGKDVVIWEYVMLRLGY